MKKYLFYIILISFFTILFSFQSIKIRPIPSVHYINNFEKNIIMQPDSISCGPASALMLLKYYSKDIRIEDIKKESLTEWFRFSDSERRLGMTHPDSLKVALHRFGIKSRIYRGDIGQLKRFISEGRPAIVLLRSGENTWHYCVVYGYDENNINLGDPGSGISRSIPIKTFYNAWKFSHSMTGERCGFECFFCNGRGRYFFNILQCDICSGKGFIDPMTMLLQSAEVYSFTMIVPD